MTQASLFDQTPVDKHSLPLAEVLRPTTLDDVVGQETVLGVGSPLRNLLENGSLTSLLFWGPPGVGKTTLARLVARYSNASFQPLSAVSSGVKELREVIAQAQERLKLYQQPTMLFIDEIHRYSKTQQDALLPYVEQGTITLIAATTENPSFQVAPALLSRLLLVRLQPLDRSAIFRLIQRAIDHWGNLTLTREACDFLADYANGDGRSVLTLLDAAYRCAEPYTPQAMDSSATDAQGKPVGRLIRLELLERLAQQNRLNYDRDGDAHYDHASAYQKSMRGSDADAALYWLAKMIAGGEDPRFIARRLMVTAAEDVGLADPQALVVATAAAEAVERLGMPEGRIPLAMATAYVARAAKSNHAYVALDAALADVQQNGKAYPVPMHLRDGHYAGAKQYGHGVGYHYTHRAPEQLQHFLPELLLGTRYLHWPPSAGVE
ncbi:MAG: replication-associated recombination protein A [Candidatus Melainabacteria bacterium]|nr:replication-associated recombination protein A [Candidatus Melainabacteria bacterium]